jgi:hypothetical protein
MIRARLLLAIIITFPHRSPAQLGGYLGKWEFEDPTMWGKFFVANGEDGNPNEDWSKPGINGKDYPVCGFKDSDGDQMGGDIPGGACAKWADEDCGAYSTNKNQRDVCTEFKLQCQRTYCSPLCLMATWEVEKWLKDGADCGEWERCGAFKTQLKSLRVKSALDAQIKAWGCSKVMQCCPMTTGNANWQNRADWLYKWVEQRTYGDMFPSPALPISACMHDPDLDEKSRMEEGKREWSGCEQCIKMVKVELRARRPEGHPDATDKGGVREAFGCMYPNPSSNLPKGKIAEEGEGPKFLRQTIRKYKLDFPQQRGMQDRCLQVRRLFEKKERYIKQKWTAKNICGCLGCCDTGSCPFPVTFNDNNFSFDKKKGGKPLDPMDPEVGFDGGKDVHKKKKTSGGKWAQFWWETSVAT